MSRFTARGAKAFIARYLRTEPDTPEARRELYRHIRSMSRRIHWTPHLFKTVITLFERDLERSAAGAIFIARDALKLATFEDAAALVCAEAAKDPGCHRLLRGRTSFSFQDCMGDFYQAADRPALNRGIVTYLNRAVAARLCPDRQPG